MASFDEGDEGQGSKKSRRSVDATHLLNGFSISSPPHAKSEYERSSLTQKSCRPVQSQEKEGFCTVDDDGDDDGDDMCLDALSLLSHMAVAISEPNTPALAPVKGSYSAGAAPISLSLRA